MYYNTLMKPRTFLTSFKIGVLMILIRISAAVRPSQTVRPRIDWKLDRISSGERLVIFQGYRD